MAAGAFIVGLGTAQLDAPAVIAALTFASVFLVLIAIMQLVRSRQEVRRRAIAFNPATPSPWFTGSAGGSLQRPAGRSDADGGSDALFAIEQAFAAGNSGRMSRLRRELVTAGFFRADAIFWFYAARTALAIGYGFVALSALPYVAPAVSGVAAAGIVLSAACSGLVIPGFYLSRRQRRLRQQCRNGFPNFLDLLVVCAEGGLTPRAGVERVSREVALTHPYLGANLFLMSLELRAGQPLVEAMENLGRRVQIDEVRSLGSLLQQTEELGTKLSDALRVFSEEMRARRLLRAEEKAHALPVKLVLPLAFFVFPVMLLVILMPIVVRIQKAFI